MTAVVLGEFVRSCVSDNARDSQISLSKYISNLSSVKVTSELAECLFRVTAVCSKKATALHIKSNLLIYNAPVSANTTRRLSMVSSQAFLILFLLAH